jgi:hypothetical protein
MPVPYGTSSLSVLIADRRIRTGGNEIWENGEWSCTITVLGQSGDPIQLKGYHSSIAVREGDVWKKRMLTWNITPAPAPAAKTAAAETK